MNEDNTTPSDADAEFAAAWGEDVELPAKPSKLAQEAAEQAKREEEEFAAEFAKGEDK